MMDVKGLGQGGRKERKGKEWEKRKGERGKIGYWLVVTDLCTGICSIKPTHIFYASISNCMQLSVSW